MYLMKKKIDGNTKGKDGSITTRTQSQKSWRTNGNVHTRRGKTKEQKEVRSKMTKPWYEPLTPQQKHQREYDRAIAEIKRLNNNCSFKLARLILKERRLLKKLEETRNELQEERLNPQKTQKKEQPKERGRLPW